MKRVIFAEIVIFMVLVVMGGFTKTAQGDSGYKVPPDLNPLSKVERRVIDNLQKGKVADLEQKSSGITPTQPLRARFLEALLTGEFQGLNISRHGVYIRNAIIEGEVDLTSAEVVNEIKLVKCVFEDDISLKDCYFKKNLQIINSHFKKGANFLRIKVEGNAYFNGSAFEGNFDIRQAMITKELSFIPYQDKTKSVRSTFNGENDFYQIKVGSNALFEDVLFNGPVNFYRSEIGGVLLMEGATFRKVADFSYSKVGYTANFEHTTFFDDAKFTKITVGEDFNFPLAKFLNEEKDANFANIKVGNVAKFKNAVFNGPVIFDGSFVGSQFNATEAKFNNSKKASFTGLIIGQLAQFTNAVFGGPVDFVGAKIGGEFKADVEQGAILEAVMLKGVICNDALFFNLTINGSEKYRLKISELQLDRTVVESKLTLKNLAIDKFSARDLQVKGQTDLTNVRIAGKANLCGSKFSNLDISQTGWPGPEDLDLSRMTYQFATITEGDTKKEGDTNWFKNFFNWVMGNSLLLKWIENSRFDKRNYLDLQEYLNRIGQGDQADKAFISMKRREWGLNNWGWLDPLNWPILLFWDLPVGYGRKPLRVVLIALGMIIIGAVFFDTRYLKDVDWPVNKEIRKLALSLDIFTPSLLNLGMEAKWESPKTIGLQRGIFLYKLFGRIFMALFFFGIWEYFK